MTAPPPCPITYIYLISRKTRAVQGCIYIHPIVLGETLNCERYTAPSVKARRATRKSRGPAVSEITKAGGQRLSGGPEYHCGLEWATEPIQTTPRPHLHALAHSLRVRCLQPYVHRRPNHDGTPLPQRVMTTLLPQNQPPPPSHPHHENLRTQDIPPAADHSNHISPTAMSSIPPPFPPANGINGSRLHQRQSGDFRAPAANGALTGANGNGPVPVPSIPHGRMANGHPTNMRSGGFDGPRSPPNNKSE